MGIHSSLLTTLLVSVLGAPAALASQAMDTHSYPSEQQQQSRSISVSQDRKASASININTADAQGLLELKGVGAKRAQTIITYREQNGPFKSIEDLTQVKGIGKKTVDLNYNKITV